MNLLRVVARPLLAAPFIADGVDALMHPRFHVERAAGVRPLIDKVTGAVGALMTWFSSCPAWSL